MTRRALPVTDGCTGNRTNEGHWMVLPVTGQMNACRATYRREPSSTAPFLLCICITQSIIWSTDHRTCADPHGCVRKVRKDALCSLDDAGQGLLELFLLVSIF